MQKNTLLKSVILATVLGFVLYITLMLLGDLGMFIENVKNIKPIFVVYVLMLSMGNYLVRYFRWQYYLVHVNIHIPFKNSFTIFMCGLIMSITPGKFGELLKSVLLKQHNGTPVVKSAPVVFFERITDVTGLLVLMTFGLLQFRFGLKIFFICLLIVLIIFTALKSSALIPLLKKYFGNIPITSKFLDMLHDFQKNAGYLLSWKVLTISTLLGTLAWFFECYGFYLILKSLAVVNTVYFATFLYTFSTLAGALSFLPGGLGVTEASLTGWLIYSGLSANKATAATIVIRFCTLWFAVLVGLLVILTSGKWDTIIRNEETG